VDYLNDFARLPPPMSYYHLGLLPTAELTAPCAGTVGSRAMPPQPQLDCLLGMQTSDGSVGTEAGNRARPG
jgi:hypothetical protein